MRATVFLLLLAVYACAAIACGLPTELQPESARAVVRACHQSGGRSVTEWAGASAPVVVSCRIPVPSSR